MLDYWKTKKTKKIKKNKKNLLPFTDYNHDNT